MLTEAYKIQISSLAELKENCTLLEKNKIKEK